MTPGIRPAHPEDIPAILEVLAAALGEPPLLRRTPELFAWKHETNPFGRSIVLVAEEGGRIAGVRAFMRWELETPDGGRLRCVRPVDTATHPDFERRGIFRALTLAALDTARDEGVDLVFNTPNPRSGAGYLSMGWQEVGWVGVLARPRLFGAAAVDGDRAPTLEEVLPAAVPFGAHDVGDRGPEGLRTPRTPAYLSWRFAGHPTARYGWVSSPDGPGGAVVRVGRRSGRVEAVLSDLLGGAGPRTVRAVRSASLANHVAGWFSAGRPERRAAIKGGLLPVPRLRTLRLVAFPLSDHAAMATDMTSWDLATSDLELL